MRFLHNCLYIGKDRSIKVRPLLFYNRTTTTVMDGRKRMGISLRLKRKSVDSDPSCKSSELREEEEAQHQPGCSRPRSQ